MSGRESWKARKDRLVRDAIDALWAGLPVVPNYIKNQMEVLTPAGGKDGPQWADWFREGRIPSTVEEMGAAITVLVRAWNYKLNYDADMFRRSLAEKDMRIGELDYQLRAAEKQIEGLQATLDNPALRFIATVRAAWALLRKLAGEIKEARKHAGKFQVRLDGPGHNKIQVIKTLRDLKPGLGLKEAKDLVDSAPCVVLEFGEDDEVRRWITKLNEAGATVSTHLL